MQNNSNSENLVLKDGDSSVAEFVIKVRKWIRYVLSKKYIIIIFSIVGASLGLYYSVIKKPVYEASTTFVLESNDKGGMLGAYAGIASSFGIDIGGGAGGGLFAGDNILELYRSRNMISKTLLSQADFNGTKQLLIHRFINFNNLRKKWDADEELKRITFVPNHVYAKPKDQLLHDSIMSVIVKIINKDYLKVEKEDEKLNIIDVKVLAEDDLFAKYFNEKLVETVNKFFLETKTKKSLENVVILQKKTDSVRSILTGSIYKAASVADATPNQNPTRLAQRIAPIQNAQASAEVNQEILGELIKNLEISKISLTKDTPLIQFVDTPILPLEKKQIGKLIAIIAGGFLGCFLTTIVIVVRKYIRDILG